MDSRVCRSRPKRKNPFLSLFVFFHPSCSLLLSMYVWCCTRVCFFVSLLDRNQTVNVNCDNEHEWQNTFGPRAHITQYPKPFLIATVWFLMLWVRAIRNCKRCQWLFRPVYCLRLGTSSVCHTWIHSICFSFVVFILSLPLCLSSLPMIFTRTQFFRLVIDKLLTYSTAYISSVCG